jgi:hypothetical protein
MELMAHMHEVLSTSTFPSPRVELRSRRCINFVKKDQDVEYNANRLVLEAELAVEGNNIV